MVNLEKWHEAIYNRANGKCEVCKKWGNRNELCGHHIASQGAHPEKRFNIDNGVNVCAVCHRLIHSGAITINSRDDLDNVRYYKPIL